jgi:ABC-type amino acid transport substrate-binding protein
MRPSNRRSFAGIGLSALSLIAVAALASHAQSASEPLRIAVEDASDVWSRADGTGFANQVVTAAFRAVKINVKLVVVPYTRCKEMAVAGQVVACFSMSHAPELARTIRFPSHALFTCNTELLQNPGAPLPSASLRDLPRGTVLGTVMGYEYPSAVAEAQRSGTIVIEPVASEVLLLRMLAAKRIQGALVNVNAIKSVDYLTRRAGVGAAVRSIGRIGTLASYLGFSTQHAQSTWALARFDDGMSRLIASGEVARLERAWADSAQQFGNRALRDNRRP